MKPKKIGKCTLFNGDVYDLLKDMPFKATLMIADPPYGLNLGARSNPNKEKMVKGRAPKPAGYYTIEGDDKLFDPRPFLDLDIPLKIMWGANNYPAHLPPAERWLVWDKREGGTPDNFADCEMAWTNLEGPARLFRHIWRGVIRRGEENRKRERRVHPMQKPIALMQWCYHVAIEKIDYRTLGDIVIFDPFMGSGTLGIVAARRGIPYYGVEIDPEHFKTACERIKNARNEKELRLDF